MESAIKLECTNKDLDTYFYFPNKETPFALSTIRKQSTALVFWYVHNHNLPFLDNGNSPAFHLKEVTT
jgi:hypothetical protein